MSILTDQEVECLTRAFLAGRGRKGGTEQELEQIIDWASKARLDATLLSMTLVGSVIVDVAADGQLTFRTPRIATNLTDLDRHLMAV